ncbi:hypothetical protein XU18_2715 [Perkinsela sp. CCAP 1560/4]|nr:hypothetical protein XU18_2715 [Perkinsela sp. CCAP 1560/4]|eukprot:KNH06433.1 hypothetical protein XU18_2715 [Perkinsela sp. CCAP 1560/4]
MRLSRAPLDRPSRGLRVFLSRPQGEGAQKRSWGCWGARPSKRHSGRSPQAASRRLEMPIGGQVNRAAQVHCG